MNPYSHIKKIICKIYKIKKKFIKIITKLYNPPKINNKSNKRWLKPMKLYIKMMSMPTISDQKNITNGDTVKKIVYSSTDINNNNNNNININGIHKNNNGILDNNNKKRSHLELYSDEINKMRENLNHIMHPEEKVE